jgi:hypothetical protein
LHALAARRPVFVRPLPVFLELWEKLGRSPNIHFYESTPNLLMALSQNPVWIDTAASETQHNATASAQQIHDALTKAIARADHGRIVRRIRAVQFASELAGSNRRRVANSTPAAQIAHWLAIRVECLARRALSIRPIYQAMRAVFRLIRKSPEAFGKKPMRLGAPECKKP